MAGAGCRRVRILCATAVTLGLAACTTPGGRQSSDVSSSPGPTRTGSTATPREPDPEDEPEDEPARPVRIAVAGDVHFEGALARRLDEPHTALAPAAAALAAADLAIVNLETSVGTGGRPEPGKRFTFSAGPAAFAALAAAGIDVASMANNHALDFGRARLPSTLRAARSAADADPPLSVVGIGRDADEAFRPALTDVHGTRVATLAASLADQDPTADPTGHWAATEGRSGVADAIEPARLLAQVRRADRAADIVVTYLHWGVQGERCPSGGQRSLAARLVEAGADVVVGTHAHRLQGDGRLGRGYVAYGLGNFAWYSPGPTGVLTLTVEPPPRPSGRATVVDADWWHAAIGTDGLAAPVRGSAAAERRAERESLRACAGLAR